MYATTQNLYDRFGQSEIDLLADHDGDGLPDAGVIDQALSDASDEMDGYFRAAGYTVPLNNTPGVTERICCNLARFNLYTDVAPEHVQKLHDDAVTWLGRISKGEINLGVASDGSEPAAESNTIEMQSADNVFSRMGRNSDGCY